MIFEIFISVFTNALLITGLVSIMMMMIEYINVQSSGKWFSKLQSSKPKQVLLGSLLGMVPGCLGGFAAVSLYSHRLISFGALIAMMICSSGDEAFVMLAMIPKEALVLFGILFIIGMVSGLLVDKFYKGKPVTIDCDNKFEVHSEHTSEKTNSIFKISSYGELLHPTKERIIVLIGVIVFIAAILSGILEHEHGIEDHHSHGDINILNERWLNIIFGILSIIVLLFTATAPEHFVKEHIWKHIVQKHVLKIFLWTFGALFIIKVGMHYFDIEPWMKENTYYLILLAAIIGMIPESGPHMVFITLFAAGHIPFSVLLTSSISQDGHTTLPLLASNKKSFAKAKLLNALIAIIIGTATQFIIHS